MRNQAHWKPSKFVFRGDQLRAAPIHGGVSQASPFVTELLAPRYQELLRRHAVGRLLDLGAGAVPLYEAYRDLVDDVTCVDWTSSPNASDHIDVQANLDEMLPLQSSCYDTVLLTDVLEHVYRPHVLFAEIARVLAPGGKLLLSVPFIYWVHEAPHDYGRYTSFMLRRLCGDNGLGILSLTPTGGSPEVFLDLIGKHIAWSSTLAALHGRAAQWLLHIPGVKRLSQYSAKWFPQGHLLVAQKQGTMPDPSRVSDASPVRIDA